MKNQSVEPYVSLSEKLQLYLAYLRRMHSMGKRPVSLFRFFEGKY